MGVTVLKVKREKELFIFCVPQIHAYSLIGTMVHN